MHPNKTPQENRLDFFVGHWQNSGDASRGAFGPGGAVTGTTDYRWEIGGKWLVYISRLELPGLGRYEVHGGICVQPQTGRYTAFAINSLGNLMVYTGDWVDTDTLVFTLVHPPPEAASRVVYRRQPDPGCAFTMSAERVSADGQFESYFETHFGR